MLKCARGGRLPAIATCAWLVLSFQGAPAFGQTLSRDQMKAITRLSCVFEVVAEATWSADTAVSPRVRTDAALAFEIEDVDVADGSAHLVGPDADADVIAKLFAWSLHFLDNSRAEAISVTTVFAEESRSGKLRAVHSRSRYQAGTESRPGDTTADQFYGECEVTQN